MQSQRRLPIGAELHDNEAHFRVWALKHRQVEVLLETGRAAGTHTLKAEPDGYFFGRIDGVAAGDRYRFRLGGKGLFPDPASRYQPEGPHGPSQVADPAAFTWTDPDWPGVSLRGQVLYEMHVGTFTPEGTWDAAIRELPELADLGITVIEMMPVADFAGRFGWGYDGVNLFAPTRLYGSPDDLRRFVDAAHGVGLGVILDVVYNHLGPDGNYLTQFAEEYFSEDETEWGKSINYDGRASAPVREFFISNAGYWIDEFHLDGLRLDATQAIRDDSPEHLLGAIQRRVKEAARGRATIVIHENEAQEARMIRPLERGGLGLDGAWNDDFHHSAMVALTGRNEAYYSDHSGSPQEFISAAKYGYLLQGQRYAWQEQRRGQNAFDLEPWRFVTFIQNHDQVANSGLALRCHLLTSPGRFRAMTALLLLGPGTPLLFQGEEFAASAPFFFFADHTGDLAAAVRKGRAEFLRQFRALDHPGFAATMPDPADPQTMARGKLDFRERAAHTNIYQLHKDLLALRKTDPVISAQLHRAVDGAVLGPQAFALRFFAPDGDDRLMLVNWGPDHHLERAPEPLLAPPDGSVWETRWSSEDPRYGGAGTPPVETMDGWRVMGEAAVLLAPAPVPDEESAGRHEHAKKRAEERKRRERTPLGR